MQTLIGEILLSFSEQPVALGTPAESRKRVKSNLEMIKNKEKRIGVFGNYVQILRAICIVYVKSSAKKKTF